MKRIAVFCGSSKGVDPEYSRQAKKLGQFLAQRNIILVFGGSKMGLMEDLSEAALQAGGKVNGVMPRLLYDKGIGHPGLTEMIVAKTMHERKMRKSELCDGIIALPGGFGTLDECFEHRDMLIFSPCMENVLQKMKDYTAPDEGKWIS